MNGLANIITSAMLTFTPAKNDIPAEQYLMDSTKKYQEKPKDAFKQFEEMNNPNKYGTGQKGLFEDLEILKKGDKNSKEYMDAARRFTKQTYYENSRQDKGGYDETPILSGDFPNNLGYKSMDDFVDDFNSYDPQTRFNLGKKAYELGINENDKEYINLAMSQFGWLAGQGDKMSHELTLSVARNLFNTYLYYAEQNDASGQISSLKYYLKLIPGDPKTIRLLKQLGVDQ